MLCNVSVIMLDNEGKLQDMPIAKLHENTDTLTLNQMCALASVMVGFAII